MRRTTTTTSIDFELAHWRDTGCAEAPSCLACPLDACVHDVSPVAVRRAAKVATLAAHLRDGKTREEAAMLMSLSVRQIERLRRWIGDAG